MMLNAAKRWSPEDSSFKALFHRINESGHTILELAVHTNNEKVVELILVEDPAYQHDRGSKNNGFMHLIYKAIDEKHEAILKLLRETYEAKISIVHKGVIDLIVAIRRRQRGMQYAANATYINRVMSTFSIFLKCMLNVYIDEYLCF